MTISTGADDLDQILGGGVEPGAVTELYGEAGSGKTNLCLQLATRAVRHGHRVAYIDTEGVSLERLEQIAGDDFEKIAESILFFEPFSADEQAEAIDRIGKLAENGKIGFVIADSATLFYRMKLGTGDDQAAIRELAQQIRDLLEIARKHDLPVVITNQVYTDIDSEDEALEPLGGQLLRHIPKVIVRLERLDDNTRRAVLTKHRSQPEGRAATFELTDTGVEDVG